MCQRNNLALNALQWPIEKMYQAVWDNLLDYNGSEWKQTLSNLEKALDIGYRGILKEVDSIWSVKGLSMTSSNLVDTWKVKPHMGIIS